MDMIPIGCRQNVKTLAGKLKTDMETAYAMILMTAMLTDLSTDDERVVEMLLKDNGYVEASES